MDGSLYWVTKDGKKMRPNEFEDKHLMNTIGYIERIAADIKQEHELDILGAAAMFQGEMASYYADRDFVSLTAMSVEDYIREHIPIYSELVEEAVQRGLMSPELE